MPLIADAEPGQIDMAAFAALIRGARIVPDIIMDVGAHDGADTARLREAFPSARCIAVEGDPDNAMLLRSRCLDAIEVMEAAVAAVPGEATWHGGGIAPMIRGLRDRGIPRLAMTPAPCRVTNLFTLCATLATVPDVLKVDVEGMTYEALIGLGPFLPLVRALHLETETYPYWAGQRLHGEVARLVTAAGFRCLRIAGAPDDEGHGGQYDSVWVKP